MVPSRALVIAKVEALFPASQRAAALAEVDRYPGDTPEGRARVQLAALRMAGGDHAQLRDWVDLALRDFRDVLSPAEYPRQAALGFTGMDRLSAAEREAVIREDRAEWIAWLDSRHES